MNQTQYISLLILAEQASGKSIREAIDAVCGAGASQRLIDDLYYGLRKEVRQ